MTHQLLYQLGHAVGGGGWRRGGGPSGNDGVPAAVSVAAAEAAAVGIATAAAPTAAAARAAPLAMPGLHRGAALAVRSLVCYIYPVPCVCTSW